MADNALTAHEGSPSGSHHRQCGINVALRGISVPVIAITGGRTDSG